jgi:hypothetical protein
MLTPDERCSGRFDCSVLRIGRLFVAWTRTKEGPGRPDFATALADLRDILGKDAILVSC